MHRFYVDPDISVAKTLHTDFYTDPAIYLLAKDKLFAPGFQFIGDERQVPEPGHCFPFTYLKGYLNEPLLLTRSNSGALHCLSNVCTHRGTIVIPEACKATQLRCRYHGRLFQLDGQFKSMPEFKEVKNFPAESDNLAQLPLFKWGPLLFASLQRNSDPAPYLQDMIDRVGWLPMDEFVLRPELSRDYVVQSHWALYCENYLEGFHIPFVHAGLNAVIDFGNYTTELFRYSNLQLGIAKDEEDTFDLPPTSPDYGKKVAAYYFFVFPNMMFNFYPWGLSINIVQPLAIDQCKVSFLTYVWNADKFNTGAGSDLNTVEMEDEEVVEAVQQGVRSRFYGHGRYSVTREQGTHHFHRIISSVLNP